VHDAELNSMVAEVVRDGGAAASLQTSVFFPDDDKYIGTPLPVLVMHLKNLQKFVTVEIEIEDEGKVTRTIRASNAQSVAKLRKDRCSVPLQLTNG
jgi:hypothetical protein